MRRLLRVILLLIVLLLSAVSLLFVSHSWLYPKQKESYEHQVSVVSYNTHQMGQCKKPMHNEVVQYLLQTDADILCLQEVEVRHNLHYLTLPELKLIFSLKYPYSYIDFKIYNSFRQYGNVVFSKYPLINKQTIDYPSRANISSRCDVVVKGDTLRLITNHLESNRIEQQDIDSVVKTRSIHSGLLEYKLTNASRLRNEQARIVHGEVKESPYPVVLVGDLNAIPLSGTYLRLRSGMRDAFLRTSNLRLGSTLVFQRLGLRIDYILCSPSLTPTEFRIDKTTASDHYPIAATIAW